MSEKNDTYLGDGLYGSFDGYQFKLYTIGSHGHKEFVENEVYLEPNVLFNFMAYVKQLGFEDMFQELISKIPK